MAPQSWLARLARSAVAASNRCQLQDNGIKILSIHCFLYLLDGVTAPWKNGKEVPRWEIAEVQKMSPSTTGRCYCCHKLSSYSIGLMRSQLTNHQVGIVLDVQAWSEKLY